MSAQLVQEILLKTLPPCCFELNKSLILGSMRHISPYICIVGLFSVSFTWSLASAQQQTIPLKVITAGKTPNGFSEPPRGWNSFGLQANPNTNPSFSFDQEGVIAQANSLLDTIPSSLIAAHDYYVSLDSGWSIGDHGDEYGRITYESSSFNIPSLAMYLHSKGLKLGVYVLPGAFCNDRDKVIYGTSIPIDATLSGNNNGFARCDFDFSKNGTQQWHDATVALFASWYVEQP
jgi:alpha-galactosidase